MGTQVGVLLQGPMAKGAILLLKPPGVFESIIATSALCLYLAADKSNE